MELTPTILRDLLECNPDTGTLFWKPRLCAQFNRQYAGKAALAATNGRGYKTGVILGRPVAAHRVIWAIVHGAWPAADIDHINHDRSDNRIANLRAVDRRTNSQNRGLAKNNTSGRVGVSRHPSGLWVAQWTRNGMKVSTYYDAFEDAAAARLKFEKSSGYHENHGKVVAA